MRVSSEIVAVALALGLVGSWQQSGWKLCKPVAASARPAPDHDHYGDDAANLSRTSSKVRQQVQ